jgi:vancomycin aglycone glucosyltransferase
LKFLFTAIGTRGDIHVLVAPALELQRRGHEVLFGAPENFRAWIEAAGLRFAPVMASIERITASAKGPEGILFAARDQAEPILEATLGAARGASLVIATGPQPAAFSAAELVNAPFAYVTYSPVYVRSSAHAPLGAREWRWSFMNALHWRAQEAAFQLVFGRAANRARMRRGLRPVTSLLHSQVSAGKLLFAFDPELEPIPPDLVDQGIVTGPLSYAETDDLREELSAFLAAGEPPVFLGFGSMGDVPPAKMLELAERIAARCSTRIVVATGEFTTPSPRVATVGKVVHAKLFPGTRGVVHHGGSGTTYSAAMAGVPQGIIPHHSDQHWYGRRVAKAGLGPDPLPLARLEEESLVQLVRTLVGNARFATSAKAYAERLARYGAPRAAADALELMARQAAT